ncbi:type II restriction/modification system DNA methylase subunit YeeA [Tissierella praeacuta]|uniref:Eco57I restriction-modification methylase domain-containing protein n=1 Tax=Tissierella praeacuta TaxID=43131 RepID=UPI0010F032CA|nr:N-6 DNA methylase [Tissierella praeacuta]TCU65639.1 type II restriction/modification system DNA methylase subunit YeeA [Tissierella praeacuta]
MKNLVNKFKQNYAYYKDKKNGYNEHSCRIEYIDPLLNLLGWDVANKKGLLPQYREVIAENYSNQTDRPDYSLTLKGVTKIFVEAKKPSVDILNSSEPALQARKYGWNANHKISILTNFEYLIIYDTTYVPKEGDKSSVARYLKYHYSDYEEKFDEIYQLISRDSVYSGHFDRLIQDDLPDIGRQKQQVDELFLEQINNWRVSLSNYLYNNNPRYNSVGVLNDVVQEFINQIVFLRICEDRNLPLYHNLDETIKDEALIKNKLEELFYNADKRYNSGLFQGEYIIFDLENNIIVEMIEGLYYPKSPYLFNIIEPNLLGKIYEMFLTEQLVLTSENKIELAKKKECANRSVVTTPIEIVKYMVSKTMSKICYKKRPEEILKLRIADIACGSGVFLEEVYEYLIQHCINWYLENDPQHLIEIENGMKKLPLEEKKNILCSCIFGVDIDVHAVEVAKFSLLLKLIEDETTPSVISSTPILPDLGNNIFYGNSLVSDRELETIKLEIKDILEVVPFSWSDINNGDKFDLIIGNPPYVSTEGIHTLLPKIEFNIYKKNYETAYKQFDKYFIFIERAIQKTKYDGYICYIVPNKFFKIGAGEKLRKLIATNGYLTSLDDFGDLQLFEDKTIYSSILIMRKNKNDKFKYTKVDSVAALWAGEYDNSILLENKSLNELPWRLTTDIEFLNLLKKLDEIAVPITKHVEIYNGIQTSAERPKPIYWFSESEIVAEDEYTVRILRDDKYFNIEKAILKPYFKPTKKKEKGLNSYSIIKTDKWIIFPYNIYGKLIPINIMETDYPGAYDYLKQNYARLVPKCIDSNGIRDVPNATKDTWYQYGRTQALTAFINNPKLIVGVLSKEPMYAFDDKDMLISSGGTAGYCAISMKKDSPYSLEYIQAWLTNRYTEKIVEIVGSDFENGFTSRGTFVLSTLPFVELDFNVIEQKNMHDEIVEKTQGIYNINKSLSKSPEKKITNVLIRQKEKLIKEIEDIIAKIYELEFKVRI